MASSSAASEIEPESETEATRPLYAAESSAPLPSRAARGPAEEERSLLDGPSFDGFAVPPSRPGREEETEAFHPGSQSPGAPRTRQPTGTEAAVIEAEERRGRFQPMAPQPPSEDATTVIKAPTADEATTILRHDPPSSPSPTASPADSRTAADAPASAQPSTPAASADPAGSSWPTGSAAATGAADPAGSSWLASSDEPTGSSGPVISSEAAGPDAGDPDATTRWPYGGGAAATTADEATTRFQAPVPDAEETANFGFGDQSVSPAEAAERRAAFARGEAERRANAAQSQLDRISAERTASKAAAGSVPDESAAEGETQPRRDNPWAEPPRERS